MTLPQTNLQLFLVMQEAGYDNSSLEAVHVAYDAAKMLFGSCFRSCGKPFVCHLVGTAGTLAIWDQPVEMLNAGLLHSAYLFGNFADGEKGPTQRRRDWLRNLVGDKTEDLIYRYTIASWSKECTTQLYTRVTADRGCREIFTVKMADLHDELADGSILVTPNKHCPFGVLRDESKEQDLLSVIRTAVSEKASNHFANTLKTLRDNVELPAGIVSQRKSFYHINPGIDDLRRSRFTQRLVKLRSSITKRTKAA